MSNLTPNEEQLITGNAMGSWNIGDLISVGDVLTFTVTDNAGPHVVTYTVTDEDVTPTPNPVNPSEAAPSFYVAMHAANEINQQLNPLGYTAAGVMPADLFSPQYLAPYYAEVVLTAPGVQFGLHYGGERIGDNQLYCGANPIPVAYRGQPIWVHDHHDLRVLCDSGRPANGASGGRVVHVATQG